MKQFLRSFLLLLLTLVFLGGSGFAQTTVTFDATTDKSSETTLTKDGVTLQIQSNKGNLNQGSYYQCYSGANFTVSSNVDITKIEFSCTASDKNKYGPGCYSTKTGTYSYSDKTGTWNGTASSVVFAASSQVRMTKVVVTLAAAKTLKSLTVSGEPTKKNYNDGDEFDPTGLVVTGTYDDNTTKVFTNGITWTKTPATLAVGNTSCTVTATVDNVTSAAYEVTGLSVIKAITLSIDPATSTVVKAPVTVTLNATAGAAIYYTTNGDEPTTASTKYEAPFGVTKSGTTVKAIAVAEGADDVTAEATYTILPDQPTFSDASKVFKDAFDVTLALPTTTDENSTIHYALNATATAESDVYSGPININAENEGDKVILHAVVVDQYGNVGQEKYCTYTKTNGIVFDFTDTWDGITPSNNNSDATKANVVAGKELNVADVVMTATNGSSNVTCLYGTVGNHNLRVYGKGTVTFTSPEGYNISEIVFTGSSLSNFTSNEKQYDKGTWIGSAHAVTFTASASVQVKTAIIKLSTIEAPSLALSETADDTEATIEANKGKTVNVTLTRTLKANVWNTICLPFDVTADQVKDVLKAEGNVRVFASVDGNCINFKEATEMKAGIPYLIKPTENTDELIFNGVTISENAAQSNDGVSKAGDISIEGTYGKKALETDGTELFLTVSGHFAKPAASTNTMRGFRAYFISLLGLSSAKINIDGQITAINGIIAADDAANAKVYNLNGQYVGNSLNGLAKGVYVVNGKKVLK